MSKNLGMEKKTLKDLIEDADITYRELASRMGMKHPQVVALCRPGANPTLRTLIKLKKELGVSLDVLAMAFCEDTNGIPDDSGGEESN